MAWHRYATDPAHHDTVIMNAVWTVYNMVILSVAASVALERTQRRAQARVHVSVPIGLSTMDGRKLAGTARELSRQGSAVRLDVPVDLSEGERVVATLRDGRSQCDLLARIAGVQRRDRTVHLEFRNLDLAQKPYLVRLMFGRPERWLAWSRSRSVHHPLRSGLQILALAGRGAIVVVTAVAAICARFVVRAPLSAFGLVLPSTFPSALEPGANPDRERSVSGSLRKRRVSVIGALAFLLGLSPTRAEGAQPTAKSEQPPAMNASALRVQDRATARFDEAYPLSALTGSEAAIALRPSRAVEHVYIDVPVTKIISTVELQLRFESVLPWSNATVKRHDPTTVEGKDTAVEANDAAVELWLNGTRVAAIPLAAPSSAGPLPLPADLFTAQTTLSFRLTGRCHACLDPRAPWVTISPSSTLRLGGSLLPIANDVDWLPFPFLDPTARRASIVPVIFSDPRDAPALQAASIVASWFGVFADVRGVRFPVGVGQLAPGNALVFVRRGSALAAGLSLPPEPDALITVRDNPRDPYGKLLVVAATRPADLVVAALTLVRPDRPTVHADVLAASHVPVRARARYDAPRWLGTDRPASIAAYTSEDRLKVGGPGSINIYFRLPPDLFLGARPSVPVRLEYEYAGVAEGRHGALHVRLNDQDVGSIRLAPAKQTVQRVDIVRLPTARLRPYANTLTVDFDPASPGGPDNAWPYVAIHRGASIDLRSLPHDVILPRLELFADAGYPFTEWPDLGRTAVVVPDPLTRGDAEAVLIWLEPSAGRRERRQPRSASRPPAA